MTRESAGYLIGRLLWGRCAAEQRTLHQGLTTCLALQAPRMRSSYAACTCRSSSRRLTRSWPASAGARWACCPPCLWWRPTTARCRPPSAASTAGCAFAQSHCLWLKACEEGCSGCPCHLLEVEANNSTVQASRRCIYCGVRSFLEQQTRVVPHDYSRCRRHLASLAVLRALQGVRPSSALLVAHWRVRLLAPEPYLSRWVLATCTCARAGLCRALLMLS